METIDRKKLGKKTRKEGKDFEIRVRADLTEKGWTVCRFDNDVVWCNPVILAEKGKNIELKIEGKLVQAKTSWRRTPHGMFPLNLSPGFPDFVYFKHTARHGEIFNSKLKVEELYDIIGVECKINGTLDKLEKEKCQWYLDNHIFSKILIAEKLKIKNRVHIKYTDFKDKYGGKK